MNNEFERWVGGGGLSSQSGFYGAPRPKPWPIKDRFFEGLTPRQKEAYRRLTCLQAMKCLEMPHEERLAYLDEMASLYEAVNARGDR